MLLVLALIPIKGEIEKEKKTFRIPQKTTGKRRNHSLLMSARYVLCINQVIRFKNKYWFIAHLYNCVTIIYAKNLRIWN